MRARPDKIVPQGGRPRPGAFTLIEMLVVIMILAVLVALVVGVGKFVRDEAHAKSTASIQAIVTSALQAFYDVDGAYPPDTKTGYYPDTPPDPPDPDDTGRVLLQYLTGIHYVRGSSTVAPDLTDAPAVLAAMERLRQLPEDALPSTANWECAILDSYGQLMRYDQDGGVNGPVVISPGRDGRFGVNDEGYADDPEMEEDNIRSDYR